MDYNALKDNCVAWVRDWFAKNGPTCSAVLGMSGGKDSTIAAAVCAEALGPERVIGVSMPQNGQSLNDADNICKYLGIHYICLPIGAVTDACEALEGCIPGGKWSVQTVQNIPPRIRMTMLYAVAQSSNGMVANTCNLSEDYIGYATLFGDAAGSFSPFGRLVVREVKGIGHALGLPAKWVDKIPDDGLPHSIAISGRASATMPRCAPRSGACTPATCSKRKFFTSRPSIRVSRSIDYQIPTHICLAEKWQSS